MVVSVVVDCLPFGTAEKMETVAMVLGFGVPQMIKDLLSMG